MRFEVSIRRTLLVRCGLGVGILAVLLSLSIYFVVRQGLYDELDDSIRETASILANQMEYEHGGIVFEWEEGIGTNSDISDEALFQYWNEKSGLSTRSPALGTADLPKFSGPDGRPDLENVSIPGRMEHARALGMVIYPYVISGESPEMQEQEKNFNPKLYPHTLVVARDVEPVYRTLAYLAATLAIGTALVFVLGFLVIRHAVNSALAPIATLTRQVLDRSENQLDSAIILPGALPSELRPLAESFDSLLSRVAAIRSRERDFIRHASHELRTPIASLSATTELALSKDREAAEYVRHLRDCAKTSSDLASLVKRLSALSRIGIPGDKASISPVSLREILGSSLGTFAKRFSASDLTISTELPEKDFTTAADPVLAALIINNLLDNAASYAPPGSTVSIRLARTNGRDELSVTNLATDLPENLDRLFEPLFRKDSSRTETADSHLGIGLTLSQEAAQAMRGTLSATRLEAENIRFTLSLPPASLSILSSYSQKAPARVRQSHGT